MNAYRHLPSHLRVAPCLAVLLTLLVTACAPAAAPSPTVAPAKPAAAKPAAPAQPAPTAAPAAKPADKPAAKAISLPKPEVTSLKIGHSALEPNGFPQELAKELGLYKKYGIENVESFYFDGAAKTNQALVSGQIEVAGSTGGPVLATLTTSVPIVQVSMNINKMTDGLFAVGGVKSAADLKGKPVAVSQFGGESHAAVLLSLQGLGLGQQDVVIQQIGGQSARIAALKAGSVAAAPVDMARLEQMQEMGFNLLLDLRQTDLEFPRSGILLRRDWMEKNPNTTLALVAANLEAQQEIYKNTDKAIDVYAEWIQAKEKDQAAKDIRAYMEVARRDLRWSKDAWEVLKEVQATANPAVKDVDVTKGYSLEFLDQLKAMGFYERVGVPKS